MNGFISANVLQHPFVELNCEDDGVGKAAIRNQRWCYDSKRESEVKLEQFVSLSMKGL